LVNFAQTIYAFIDTDADGAPDVTSTRAVLIDLTPPPAPDSDGISLEGGNEGLTMRWPKVDTTLYPDLRGYQILCNRGGALQVFKEGSFDPFYQSCPASVAAGGGGVTGLDPLFVCSPLLSPSTTSHRIKILQNDIVYGAAVVAIDESGNASTPDVFYAAPGATENFYDKYRAPGTDVPGGADGGLCNVAPAASSRLAGTTTGFIVAGAALLARRRRRRVRHRGAP